MNATRSTPRSLLRNIMLTSAVLLGASMTAHAYDTSWLQPGQPLSSAKLKADLDEAQFRLAALEGKSAVDLTSAQSVGGVKTWSTDAFFNGRVAIKTSNPGNDDFVVNGAASKPGGGSWSVFSDARLKDVKGPFTTGLAAVRSLEPVRYEYKRDNARGVASRGEHVGFVAQSVQKHLPEAVREDGQGYLLVDSDPILWAMLNAIKEQQVQIEGLRAEREREQRVNGDLRTRLENLEKTVAKLAARERPSRP